MNTDSIEKNKYSKLAVLSFILALSPFLVGLTGIYLRNLEGEAGVIALNVWTIVMISLVVAGYPASLVTAIAGLVVIRRSGEPLKGRRAAITAMVLVTLVSVAIALASPTFIKGRNAAIISGCECVLCCIDAAKEQVAMVEHLKVGDPVQPEKVYHYIKNGTNHLICPKTKRNTYTIGKIGESPRCSYHTNLVSALGQ